MSLATLARAARRMSPDHGIEGNSLAQIARLCALLLLIAACASAATLARSGAGSPGSRAAVGTTR